MASRGKKILIGCGIGCGALLLGTIVAIVAFFSWLNRPGQIPERDARFGPESTAFVEWFADLEDPGTVALVDELLAASEEINRRSAEGLPLGEILGNYKSGANRRELEKIFPMLLTWVHDAGESGEDLLTVSSRGFGNQLRFSDWVLCRFVADDRPWLVRYRDECIYHLEGRDDLAFSALFLRGATIFVSRDLPASERTVDRLDTPTDASRGSRIDPWLSRIPEDRRVRGAVLNVDGDLAAVWESVVGPHEGFDWSRIEAVVLHGGFDASTDLELALDFVCHDGDCAGVDLAPLSETLRAGLDDSIALEVVDESPVDARRIVLRIDDVAGRIASWVEDATDAKADRSDQPS